MFAIQDVKDAFGSMEWSRRVAANPRRIYGFLLTSDEHQVFLNYIQKAWRTLHTLSGESCDIFTFEQRAGLHEPWLDRTYLHLSGPILGEGGRTVSVDEFVKARPPEAIEAIKTALGGVFGSLQIDNGIKIPDRPLCYEIRDKLFVHPESIILPGLALFSSPDTKDATYIKCGGLNSQQLSDLFQKVLNLIGSVYRGDVTGNRFDVYEAVTRAYRKQQFKERVIKAVSTLTIKDLFSILGTVAHLVTPKSSDQISTKQPSP